MTLKTDIDQIAVDAGILHSIVQGPVANVTTAGGPVKSVAKAVSDAEAAIISGASSYLVQVQAERDTVLAAKALAESAAASAGSVMQQDLSAIDRTVFASTTLVDAFLYDTSKDSDGGAWRKRCAHTSWENETLSGNWLGSAANEAAARAISGAVTGSYYYDTTAAVFYKLNAGAGVTQVYRGNVRQFPAQVLITAGTDRVILWDLTQAGVPMWMVFKRVANYLIHSGNSTGVAMRNGVLAASSTTQATALSFVSEAGWLKTSQYSYTSSLNIGNRNTVGVLTITSANPLVNGTCNAVAMTVLPNAPVDVATGLPVPTIAVATAGGVSVVKDDGNVWDITSSAGGTYSYATKVEFFNNELRFAMDATGVNRTLNYSVIPTADKTVSSDNTVTTDKVLIGSAGTAVLPRGIGTSPASFLCRTRKGIAAGGASGGTRVCENPATPAKAMVAYVTKDYTSGWLLGDIRGAWLADTVAETLTGAEMVTNGTFATDATGWTAVNGAGLSVASGELTVTNSGATNGCAAQAITTVAGKTYVASATVRRGTATSIYLSVGTTAGGYELAATNSVATSNTTIQATFTATGTTTYISARNDAAASGTGIYDNISCRLADVDRSVKAKGLQVFGSLTKAAVASGAALMGYSGFSAANFLEQPYNADLDFGTGDFCIMGWLKQASNSAHETVFHRDSAVSAQSIQMRVNTSGVIDAFITDDAYVTYDTASSAAVVDDLVWRFISLVRSGSSLTLCFNGVQQATTTISAAAASLSNTAAKFRLGAKVDASAPMTNGGLALWRAGATAPTAEQLRHIYETEKALFEANAQCCLAGSSTAVTALAYDDETDLLHVGTSYGRSAFKGLVRVASEATPVGAIVALAAGAGVIVQGGATAVDVYVPAYSLREELLRDAEQMARFGQNLIPHNFTATASQTNFALPVGWEIVLVYQQGALKQETTSWTRSFDGFIWSVVLGTGATVSDWISILAKRV